MDLNSNNSQETPIKFIWSKGDTFTLIHKRLCELKGKQVVNKQNEKLPLTIFNVGRIEKMALCSFLTKTIPMWGFCTEYGLEDLKGNKLIKKYNLMIPRESTYKKDSVGAIVIDENHPFIFYEI